MRTLIVGAGMAGLSLAGRLCQQGRPPVVVERSAAPGAGYAIGLYPLGSCVFHGLGTYDRLVERSSAVARYELADGRGRILQALDMSVLTGAIGPMLMLGRADLVEVLEASCGDADVRRGVKVTAIEPDSAGVDVAFDEGRTERFDLVVGCDGMSSTTRELVFGRAGGYDAGWVLATWWAPPDEWAPDVAREWWGDGWFFGAYPAPAGVMCAAGGPAEVMAETGTGLPARVRDLMGAAPEVRAAVEGAGDDVYRWPMRDVRAPRWIDGRVALCGDAATGFLPTAGAGASNALRAGAALADELSRADAGTVPLALELYEKRCRPLVERNQTDSRRLARLMFLRRSGLTRLRDQLARRYPARRMLGAIIDSARQPF